MRCEQNRHATHQPDAFFPGATRVAYPVERVGEPPGGLSIVSARGARTLERVLQVSTPSVYDLMQIVIWPQQQKARREQQAVLPGMETWMPGGDAFRARLYAPPPRATMSGFTCPASTIPPTASRCIWTAPSDGWCATTPDGVERWPSAPVSRSWHI